MGSPRGAVVKNLPANPGAAGDTGFSPWMGKVPWRRKWQPTLVFVLGKSHGYSGRGRGWDDLGEWH